MEDERDEEANTANGHLLGVAASLIRLCRFTACIWHETVPGGLPARARLPAWFPRPRFVDGEGTARELCAIESVNGAFCRVAVRHLDEAKAARAAGLAVSHNPNRVDGTIRLEELTQVLLRGGKSQVAHKDIHAEFSREKRAPEAKVYTDALAPPRLPTPYSRATALRYSTDTVRHSARKSESTQERCVLRRRGDDHQDMTRSANTERPCMVGQCLTPRLGALPCVCSPHCHGVP
jgi:hypothetical protein